MNTFFIIFLGIPAIEIFLLIKIGGKIGALNTITLIFLTAIIGIYYARLQGIQTLRSGITSLYQNKAPISPPILINKNISIAGMPINIKKNVFICLIQNYIIHVYLSNYE